MSYARSLRRQMNKHFQIKEPKVLEAHNETLEDTQLHPTKGPRKLSVRRSKAQIIMSLMRMRKLPWSSRSMSEFQ